MKHKYFFYEKTEKKIVILSEFIPQRGRMRGNYDSKPYFERILSGPKYHPGR